MIAMIRPPESSVGTDAADSFDAPILEITEPRQPSRAARLDRTNRLIVIGRSRQCDIILDDPLISARHARISWSPEGFQIEDLGSRHGTRVNGERLDRGRPRALTDQADISIGQSRIRYACYQDKIAAFFDACSPPPLTVAEQSEGDPMARPLETDWSCADAASKSDSRAASQALPPNPAHEAGGARQTPSRQRARSMAEIAWPVAITMFTIGIVVFLTLVLLNSPAQGLNE